MTETTRKTTPRPYITNRYIYSPAEAAEFIEAYDGNVKDALNAMIDHARDYRTRVYKMPCQWTAHLSITDESAIVTRTARRQVSK